MDEARGTMAQKYAGGNRFRSNIMEKRLLSIEELGQYLGIRPQTIRNRLSSGTFPIRAFKICGRIRFDTREIDRYLLRLRSGPGNEVDSQRAVCDTTS